MSAPCGKEELRGGWGGAGCVWTESAGAKEQGLQLVGRKAQVGVMGLEGLTSPWADVGEPREAPTRGEPVRRGDQVCTTAGT